MKNAHSPQHPKRINFIAWVYIMTNWSRSVLYVGFTRNIQERKRQHQTKRNPRSFTARYTVNKLVYYQGFLSVTEAETAEQFIKGKTRAWKQALVVKQNPRWRDLAPDVD